MPQPQRRKILATVAAGTVLILSGPDPADLGGAVFAAGQEDAVTCGVEQAPMRDGVTLATEVYRPAGQGRFPVILQRTPYNRRSPAPGTDCDSPTGQFFAERGYVLLNQDV